MIRISLLIFAISFNTVMSFSINNTIADLKLICSDRGILLSIFPENALDRPGRIYVKGRSSDEQCLKVVPQGLTQFEFNVPIGNCNMDKTGNQKGSPITYHIVYVVSFHSIFLTKIDRAYRLTCTFGDTNNLMVTNFYSVSMIPTTEVPSQNLATTNCSYSIHANDTIGPELRYTKIGEKVVHIWKCDNLKSTQFMWVHTCAVSPEYGNGTKIIDTRGCTVDRVIIDQLQYPRTDMVIGHHHAYKFADYPTLLFKCSITICDSVQRNCPIANTKLLSVIFKPPDCATTANYGSIGGRRIRVSGVELSNQPITFQVISEPLSVFASNEELPDKRQTPPQSEDLINSDYYCAMRLNLLITMAAISGSFLLMYILCLFKNRR